MKSFTIPIGETVSVKDPDLGNITLRVDEATYGCRGCHFRWDQCGKFSDVRGECSGISRLDKISAIFVKVESDVIKLNLTE